MDRSALSATPTASPAAGVATVRRGDTLYAISRRHGVSVGDLARRNNLRAPYVIFVGQSLRLPEAMDKTSRAAARVKPPPPREPGSTGGVSNAAAPYPASKPSGRAQKPVGIALTANPPRRSGRGFAWPLHGEIIDAFGPRAAGGRNDGVNIATARGTPIKASENGVVVYAGNELKSFGNLLLIKHDNGWMTAYAHADAMLVKRGATVKRGQVIATVGDTGGVSIPQLHFEMRNGSKVLDPLEYLERAVTERDHPNIGHTH